MHLAAKVPKPPTVPDSVQNSEETRRLDDQIISVAEHTQIPLTYLSGCSLYENNHAYLKTEDSPLNVSISSQCLNSKMIGNFRVQRIPHSWVIRLSAPLSAYLPSSTALMNFFNQLISTNAIRVTGLGNRAQDYLDIRDIASAPHFTQENALEGIFNLSSGLPISMRLLAEK